MTANVPTGTVIAQGHNNTVDARTIVTHTTNVTVSVEDRARILAEVGAALRPVLEGLHDRISRLEADNRTLRDTLAAVAGVVTPGQASASAERAEPAALHAPAEPAPADVGTPLEEDTDPSPWPAGTPWAPRSFQPSL